MRGHNFSSKAFWDKKPKLSCLKLTGLKFEPGNSKIRAMPNYCTVTFSLFSEDAVRLRPLKQKAATSKVTPCLRSTNNIIVLNAFMPHRCLHHFYKPGEQVTWPSHIPPHSVHDASGKGSVSRRTSLQLKLTLAATESLSKTKVEKVHAKKVTFFTFWTALSVLVS